MLNVNKDAEKAYEIHTYIIANEQNRRKLFLENMRLIHEIKDTELYTVIMGDENAPWTAYLSQFEVFYTRSKVDTMSRVYRKFIREIGIIPDDIINIPFSKLTAIMSFVSKDNVDEWLTKARTLTAQDFNDEVRKENGGVGYLECEHKRVTKYETCDDCGFRHKHNEHETKR